MSILAELLTGTILTPAVLIASVILSLALLSGLGAQIAEHL